MDYICKELNINKKNIFCTDSSDLFTVVVHNTWLKKWMKNVEVDISVNNVDFDIRPSESVPYPFRKIFIKVLNKNNCKVLPLPRYKLNEINIETPLTFSQLLQYVSQNNQRNLWKESYKKYCQQYENSKESSIVNLIDHDQLLSEVLLRLYGCNIIRVKQDVSGKVIEYNEIPNKYVFKSYEAHVNLLPALFIIETDNNFFTIYNGHYEYNLLECLNFSPNLIDMNYGRGLFIVFQLLNVFKAVNDRGLCMAQLRLNNIYLSENLWLQVVPNIMNNVYSLDPSLIQDQSRNKQSTPSISSGVQSVSKKDVDWCWRNDAVQLEKLCMLWVRGRISNLDYLLHLNRLVGRNETDPQTHFMVPWVTDFISRCGKNWRDLTKSKYRLNKGDRQLDMTYDVASCSQQIPHHVTDPLSDITYYVYLARRTPKEVLCKHVRYKWVPAEYPSSIQRMQEWTPDECIPEFYTDPTVFKSIHEDLPDLGVPLWASCAEDFITKHREALESAHVSENLHHWIDITFGYKLSGSAAVKAKNVCLSLVDGHTELRRGSSLRLLSAPHPPRAPRPPPPQPPRLHWTAPREAKKFIKQESSEETDDEDESTSAPQHVSRLNVPPQRIRLKQKSSSRARSLSKSQVQEESCSSHETRASSHSRHFRVQRSELGKGVIYLPKEFNPIASIQTLEALDNFKTKCFFSEASDKMKDSVTRLNHFPLQGDLQVKKHLQASTSKDGSDDTAFTNLMFLASYDQSYLRKFSQDAHFESIMKDRISRSSGSRFTTDAAVYKQFVTESRREDMIVVGCLIVEIFLHQYMRPLRSSGDNFVERYNNCRTVLKYNFNTLPKCVSYISSLLLDVKPPSLSFKNELCLRHESTKQIIITDKGLPPPTPSQLLQPYLMQHLIPFPQSYQTLYKLLSTLHEYEVTSNELSILYMYECDGIQCEAYKNVDKTKLHYSQRIAEGKIQACSSHLDVLLSQIDSYSQFDVLDIFVLHYIELLRNKNTSVLAAWYLFDTVSRALGPEVTREKLLKHILYLYEDDETASEIPVHHKMTDVVDFGRVANKHKFVKLYHNIFLLQLMVRLGLQCFLDNFTQHLVEAVGGYKDDSFEPGTPCHLCHNKSTANKKPRYSDDNVKNALSTACDIFSPDTSYGSEHIITPNIDQTPFEGAEKDTDNKSENEVFHFESDAMPPATRRSKSPVGSIDSYQSPPANEASVCSPSPSKDVLSPSTSKYFTPQIYKETASSSDYDSVQQSVVTPVSPSIDIPVKSMFTSYLHFAEEDSKRDNIEYSKDSQPRQVKSFDVKSNLEVVQDAILLNLIDDEYIVSIQEISNCKISDMSSESVIWLAHKLGPVLTCRYITRNLLKMLTLCYIGKENLVLTEDQEKDEFDEISVVNSRVVGDINAMKVISCLTAIVGMYGEHLIIFQYLPHMGDLIASCRRRLSAPLEGGVVACLQLVKYLLPCMSDAKVMEQLSDSFLKMILQPALRLASTSRCAYPNGSAARSALARKLLNALHVLALRIGPEMSRKHLCVNALQRFFLAFDKASGKTDNWPKPEDSNVDKGAEDGADNSSDGIVELCRDGSMCEWQVREGRMLRADLPDLACTPPAPADCPPDPAALTAQEELLMVFNEELAYKAHTAFSELVGADTLEKCLNNADTIRELCRAYETAHNIRTPQDSRPEKEKRVQPSFSDEPISRKSIDISAPKPDVVADHMASSSSFGSNVTLVGNRIDVAAEGKTVGPSKGLDVVACKIDTGVKSNRHLRGDWLIYWEHEIGRPDKDTEFNLKQIKLQTFAGHTQSVKAIYCLDNEHSFISGSKDKTVRLWSLRNQGDGKATTQCNWTYTGHKKGILSLAFLESLRLAVSTDSVVHIWDPFMESVVSQLDNIKTPISLVNSLGDASPTILAATTEATVKLIDARACNYTHDLKLSVGGNWWVRSACACARWSALGLASGHVLVLDLRTGTARAHWKAHDGEVLRLAVVDEHRLLSSGLDQVTALWNVDDGELIAHLKGTSEPVHCLAVYGTSVVWGTTNNRIGVHEGVRGGPAGGLGVAGGGGLAGAAGLRPTGVCTTAKLRPDVFRGLLSSMALLPLNRLLLLGADHGPITLLC